MTILENLRKKHELVRAVAYTRFSTDMQREESVEAQLRAIHELDVTLYRLSQTKAQSGKNTVGKGG